MFPADSLSENHAENIHNALKLPRVKYISLSKDDFFKKLNVTAFIFFDQKILRKIHLYKQIYNFDY
jgi:hypothetical protein